MQASGFILLGGIIGASLMYAVNTGYQVLDSGISYTYACDQNAREADARLSAEALLGQLLEDVNSDETEDIATAAGLQVDRFAKGDHELIVIGQTPETAALTFMATIDGNVEPYRFPGTEACEISVDS